MSTLLAVEDRELKSCSTDTRCSFASTDEVEAGGVDNAGLPPPGEIELQRHLKEHEGRVDAVLVQLQHVAQRGQPSLSCRVAKQVFTCLTCVLIHQNTQIYTCSIV